MLSACRTAVHVCSWFAKHARALATSIVVICTAGVCPLPCVGQTTPWNTNGSGIWYSPTGVNVGIGTASPAYRLDAAGGFSHFAYNTSAVPPSDNANGGLIVGWNRGNGTAEVNLYNAFDAFGGFNAKSFVFSQKTGASTYNDLLTIQGNGNVGIGTTAPQYKLAVNGTIGAKEVIVTNAGWSDYVFKPDYRLKPLKEIALYIKANHHLPEIPSEAEVKEKGVGVGEMQAKLLAKVEELTLHIIQAEERNDRLERQNREMRERLSRVERRIAH